MKDTILESLVRLTVSCTEQMRYVFFFSLPSCSYIEISFWCLICDLFFELSSSVHLFLSIELYKCSHFILSDSVSVAVICQLESVGLCSV